MTRILVQILRYMKTYQTVAFVVFSYTTIAYALPRCPTLIFSAGAQKLSNRDLPVWGLFGDSTSDTTRAHTPHAPFSSYIDTFSRTDGPGGFSTATSATHGVLSSFTTMDASSNVPHTTSEANTLTTSQPIQTTTFVPTQGNSASISATATSLLTEGSSTDDKTWKVVGVAVIAVTAVGLIISSIMFFDHWWRIVQDFLCCRGHSSGEESLVPDWERGIWEIKSGPNLDNHRSSKMFISDDLEHGDQKAHYSIPRKPELVVLPPENSSSSEQRVLPWEINSPLHRQPSHHSIHTSPSQ